MNNEEKSKGQKKKKSYLTFREMMTVFKVQPKVDYLWGGIKEKSVGLVFGPSKSGKTIVCENLAIMLAIGKKEFLNRPLKGLPRKVLFVGLEEYWINRAERNKKQFDSLNSDNQKLMDENYLYQHVDFEKRILTEQNWKDLEKMIIESEAEIVFIDSITRMNPGKLENGTDVEKMMQRLRDICYDNGITLICIHHTPKMEGYPISMDKIKGSSVFAQETDFAIGINKTVNGHRYLKDVFYRYASDDSETVKEFMIDSDIVVNEISEVTETEILNRTDRRRNIKIPEAIIKHLNTNKTKLFTTSEMVQFIIEEFTIKKRQAEKHLSDLASEGKLNGSKHGFYSSNLYNTT